MKIGIDFMGGDYPEKISAAINRYVKENSENIVYVFTTKNNSNNNKLISSNKIELIFCQDAVNSHDDPAFVVRKKKDSTLVVGAKYLVEKKIDAFISAGNTGALVAAGIFVVKRMEGVSKPALPGLFPKQQGKTPLLVLDLGANIKATVQNMVEYAKLGNEYMKVFYKISNPKLKLLNIGEEESKGTDLYQETYNALKQEASLNFEGNIEPRYLLKTDSDIILTDGFAGNIMLKSLEGTVFFFQENLKKIFLKNLFTKLSALIIKKDFINMKDKLDYKKLGATPILGINELLLKAHGSSNEEAYYNALKQAEYFLEVDLINKLKESVK